MGTDYVRENIETVAIYVVATKNNAKISVRVRSMISFITP